MQGPSSANLAASQPETGVSKARPAAGTGAQQGMRGLHSAEESAPPASLCCPAAGVFLCRAFQSCSWRDVVCPGCCPDWVPGGSGHWASRAGVQGCELVVSCGNAVVSGGSAVLLITFLMCSTRPYHFRS